MGKNNNQIATFADLYSIGYRLPSNTDVTSKECVTYRDLVTIGASSDPQYKVYLGSHNPYFSDKIVNITWEDDATDLHEEKFGSTPEATSIDIGTFTGVDGSCSLSLPWLHITVPDTHSNISNGYFYINYVIKDGDVIIAEANSDKIGLGDTGNFYLYHTEIDVDDLVSSTNYTIGLKLHVEYTSNSYYGSFVRIQIAYMSSDSVYVYSPYKCVRWSKIPGSDGQTPSTYSSSTAVSVPVTCYLKEEIALVGTAANTVTFYYCYKTEGSETVSTAVVGKCTLADDNVSEDATKKASVLINPKISGKVITEDFLRIKCGTTGTSQSWYYKCETFSGNNSTSSWTSLGKSTSTLVEFTNVSYHEMLRDLKKISFKVD